MSMDIDIARWILEFLLRQSLDDRLLNSLVRVLPLANDNSGLKKTMLLRRIESEISKNSVTEKILELLEYIEQLDYEEGIEVLGSMKTAYCAVAVYCTVRYLDGNEDDKPGKYFDAVKRIWRGRVCKMQRSEKVGLVSEELWSWKDEIEAAVWDESACENVVVRSKEIDALEAVRVYFAEEKAKMGPSFLELVAENLSDDSLRKALRLGSNGLCEQVTETVGSFPNAGQDLVVSNSNKELHKGNVLSRRKHVANRHYRGATSGTSRGVKIADTEDMEVGTSSNKYDIPPTPEVNKVQEALESSSLELQAVVKDPLPDALQLADTIISNMRREHVDHEPVPENHSSVEEDAPHPSVDKNAQAVHDNEGNLVNQHCIHQNNPPKPSLMTRNSTARTYEWDDSVDGLHDGSFNRENRLHLPTPNRRVCSPLKKYEVAKLVKRRRFKKWSTLEEDTLRTGVQKYGKGNWKLILNMYRDIFEERTEVDLKDKWRNLTRHC